MIIQGANEPVVLLFKGDLTQLQGFSSVLVNKASLQEMKHWTLEDIRIGEPFENEDGEVVTWITLPLTEAETLGFTFGAAVLQTKWLLEGNVWFADDQAIHIKRSLDSTRLTEDV